MTYRVGASTIYGIKCENPPKSASSGSRFTEGDRGRNKLPASRTNERVDKLPNLPRGGGRKNLKFGLWNSLLQFIHL